MTHTTKPTTPSVLTALPPAQALLYYCEALASRDLQLKKAACLALQSLQVRPSGRDEPGGAQLPPPAGLGPCSPPARCTGLESFSPFGYSPNVSENNYVSVCLWVSPRKVYLMPKRECDESPVCIVSETAAGHRNCAEN